MSKASSTPVITDTHGARLTGAAIAPRQLILNNEQAEAIYSAMCALNNVGGRLCRALLNDDIEVSERSNGTIQIFGADPEQHANQHAFATAYSLNTGA